MIRKFILSMALICLFLPQTSLSADFQPRIIGGTPASPGEWPATVALYRHTGGISIFQFCAGTLVAPEWVLTAAHCVADLVETPSILFAKVGATNLVLDGELIDVDAVYVHNNFNAATQDNDIALVQLRFPADVSLPNIETIPFFSGDPVAGTLATIVGWGATVYDEATDESSEPSVFLLEALVPIIEQTECNTIYDNVITDNMICAGDITNGGVDSCQGDSGGPMMVEQNGEFRQVGIVSFGVGCGLPQFPGVYTRVARFTDWISNCMAGVECDLQSGGIDGTVGDSPIIADGTGTELPSGNLVNDSTDNGGAVSWIIFPLMVVFVLSRRRRDS